MLEVIKTGESKYGYWVYGVLKFGILEIKNVFSVNRKVLDTEKTLKPLKIYVNHSDKGILRFRIDL